MTITYYDFHHSIPWTTEAITILSIENSIILRQFVEDLRNQIINNIDERLIFHTLDRKKSLNKQLAFSLTPFDLVFDSRMIQTAILNLVSDLLEEEMQFIELKTKMANLINQTLFDFPVDFEIIESIENKKLLKPFDISLSTEFSFVDKIKKWMEVNTWLLGIDHFIFLELKSYLTAEEIAELYQFAIHRQIHLLLIERKQQPLLSKEKYFIVDSHGNEIY